MNNRRRTAYCIWVGDDFDSFEIHRRFRSLRSAVRFLAKLDEPCATVSRTTHRGSFFRPDRSTEITTAQWMRDAHGKLVRQNSNWDAWQRRYERRHARAMRATFTRHGEP
jgi:hypothetical protein